MRVNVAGAVLLSLSFSLLAVPGGYAQTPAPPPPQAPQPAPQPLTGFVPPYEIVHTLRAAGFDPVTHPLREGTTYVLRATDFRGILMRVVVDARTGAIRDVNRIVPGPGPYGQIGPGPQPYGSPPPSYHAPSRYGMTVYDEPEMAPRDEVPLPLPRAAHSAMRPAGSAPPPLPRPRPPALASRKAADDAKPGAKSLPQPDPKADVKDGANVAAKPGTASDPQPNAAATTAPVAPVVPKKPPPAVLLND